jgi:uncharacterized protein with PQ loop repeat
MPELLAIVATLLTAIFLVPQIARLLSRGDTAGLSAVWAGFGVVTNLAWVAYVVGQDLWVASIAPGMAVVSYSITLFLIVRRTSGIGWWRSSFWYSASLLAAEALVGPAGLGVLLAMTPVVQIMPAVIAIYGTRRPTGVAPATWVIAAVEALLWGGYGWLVADLPLVGYGVVTVLGSVLILARCWATRSRIRFDRPLVEV